jgi:hypothetical protein
VRLSLGIPDVSNPNRPVYMFMNQVGVHFEAVRTTDSYSIPLSRALDITMVLNEDIVKTGVERMSNSRAVREAARNFQIRLGNSENPDVLRTELARKIDEAKGRLLISRRGGARQTRRSRRHSGNPRSRSLRRRR